MIWSAAATGHLENIVAYISDFSPLAAQRLALRLISASDSLATHPLRGRQRRDGSRELVIVSPYLIRYDVTEMSVEILSVRHGAERPD